MKLNRFLQILLITVYMVIMATSSQIKSGVADTVLDEMQVNLVAFKNTVNFANILTPIPAGSQNHGLKNDVNLFSSEDVFPAVLITEEQFREARKCITF